MHRGPSGTLIPGPALGGEVVRAFVPRPLPPEPPLELDAALREAHDQTLLALGRLDSLTSILPDTGLFLYLYMRKEAVLSSQIEGTQSSLSDLLLFELEEAPGVPQGDVRSVSRYVQALELGVSRLAQGWPLTGRLFREMHAVLLSDGRGSELQPGEYRSSQNWIGGPRPGLAAFVPPPPHMVNECMGELERFINDQPQRTPILQKIALAHVQFETIHPFLDGNGRLGRLLTTLMLVAGGVLQSPLLYPSLYLKTHRSTYYDLLQRVRTEGDFEAWLEFFLAGIRETAQQAVASARALQDLFRADRQVLSNLGRLSGSAIRIHDALQRHPIQSATSLAASTGLSTPTVQTILTRLTDQGLLQEITGRHRGRIYRYHRYLAVLEPSVG